MTESELLRNIQGGNVAYITVKNLDYIRTQQFERLLQEYANHYVVISSGKEKIFSRIIDIRRQIKEADLADMDVIIAGFLPQLIWEQILQLNEWEDKVLIADFFLSLYDTIVEDRAYISQRNLLSKLLRRMDRKVLRQAQLIITDTGCDAAYLISEYQADPGRFETLYLQADPRYYGMEETVSFREERENEYTVLYFGTGLPLQGTDMVIDSFRQLDAVPDIRFIFIGGLNKQLKKLAAGISHLEITDWLPQDELARQIRNSDLCLAGHFNPKIDKARRTIPGKAFIYEAMGKNMILGETKANHEVFIPDERHHFVPQGDSKRLSQAIWEEYQKWKDAQSLMEKTE